jgi:hypothetical protein
MSCGECLGFHARLQGENPRYAENAMYKLTVLRWLAPAVLVFCACASPRYLISTMDGTLIQTQGEPKLNKDTDMYEYRDLNGQDASVRHSDVKQILKQ